MLKGKTLKRTTLLALFLLAAAVLLLVRILIFQTFGYEKYQSKVISQMTTESVVTAKRGTIYDRNGKILATNRTAYRLFISPSGIVEAESKNTDKSKTQVELIASGIAEILGDPKYYEKVKKEATYTTKLDRTIEKTL